LTFLYFSKYVYASSAHCLSPVNSSTNQDFYFPGDVGTLCKLYNYLITDQ